MKPDLGPAKGVSQTVQRQYEEFPYPPVGWLSLPKRGQGYFLSYELGTKLAFGEPTPHRGIRILVAGAGTLEPLVVSQAHPEAAEIVAVDLSQKSLSQLRFKKVMARTMPWRPRMAPIREICADLLTWEEGQFDFIIASNVIHHVSNPGELLKRLATWLAPSGVLRIVTYPKASRIFMRETSAWLRLHGLNAHTPDLVASARKIVEELPASHPIRSCFESQPEIHSPTGIVDAFLNACEMPLSPLDWKKAAGEARLTLVAEGQTETSRSDFLDSILKKKVELDSWEKLQILDDTLELCANPVLWFKKELREEFRPASFEATARQETQDPPPASTTSPIILSTALSPAELAALLRNQPLKIRIPSRLRKELADGLRRTETLLSRSGFALSDLLEKLAIEVGPRISAGPQERILPGLSIGEYNEREILGLPMPWADSDWKALEDLTSGRFKLNVEFQGSLSEQASFLQFQNGALESWIEAELIPSGFGT